VPVGNSTVQPERSYGEAGCAGDGSPGINACPVQLSSMAAMLAVDVAILSQRVRSCTAEVTSLSVEDLVSRVIRLKHTLPGAPRVQSTAHLSAPPATAGQSSADLVRSRLCAGADVSILVLTVPEIVFSSAEHQLEHIAARVATLRQNLPDVDVDALVCEDPQLLTTDVSVGVRELNTLWPKEVFKCCDLAELGLAIRSLSDPGPPQTM
jgi:hypothetical protein